VQVNEALEQFPVAQEYLAKCTPITDTSSYKKEGTELRHFEKVQLDGFIALGDAMCNFNPVFGQGQTSAADQVLALDNMLRQLKTGTHTMIP
jgi:2-polyprenyl-6-methoxyphenol hydroxylase-like FAD-dependent oxidoreductase